MITNNLSTTVNQARSNQATVIARKLLQNEFICPISDRPNFDWLKNADNYQFLDERLAIFGLKLVQYSDGDVITAVNIAPTEEDRKKVVKQFDETINQLQPMIELLIGLTHADDKGETLYMGKIIQQDKLVLAVNHNKAFESSLHKLMAKDKSFGKPNDQQIDALLSKMRQNKLLQLTNPMQKVYQVTGKIEYINRLIAFISENYLEKEPETLPEQQGLGI